MHGTQYKEAKNIQRQSFALSLSPGQMIQGYPSIIEDLAY